MTIVDFILIVAVIGIMGGVAYLKDAIDLIKEDRLPQDD